MPKICRITILAFLFGDIPKGPGFGYTNIDLINGIDYCENLLDEGFKTEPMDDFNLKAYIEWANKSIALPESVGSADY